MSEHIFVLVFNKALPISRARYNPGLESEEVYTGT